ncbi:hypothetical protein [Caproiciproducens sp. CPB-2]|uniref:hypothetical protein n=1 Tax=Caproiciproducens sp. CPB-2 TaxID=3030017 RepID=UPI0023DB2FA1|nr:hypothetical protein [Caproiciproducens sp. CPB-2]MDF1496333.1 hypothetical protein [Caproiciproducens sp. CPB-2]
MAEFKKPQPTQRALAKEKERAQFNIDPVKDFISPKNRAAFGHKCDKCSNKFRCHKWYGAIIIICDRFGEKSVLNKPLNNNKA